MAKRTDEPSLRSRRNLQRPRRKADKDRKPPRLPPEETGGGRKLKATEETFQRIRALASIHCTLAEAAAVLNVDKSTLIRFRNDYPAADRAWNEGLEEGKAGLRKTQFALAQRNPAMAIFLGKNLLGQRDRFDWVEAPPADLSKLSPDELDVFERLLRKAAPDGGGSPETPAPGRGGSGAAHAAAGDAGGRSAGTGEAG